MYPDRHHPLRRWTMATSKFKPRDAVSAVCTLYHHVVWTLRRGHLNRRIHKRFSRVVREAGVPRRERSRSLSRTYWLWSILGRTWSRPASLLSGILAWVPPSRPCSDQSTGRGGGHREFKMSLSDIREKSEGLAQQLTNHHFMPNKPLLISLVIVPDYDCLPEGTRNIAPSYRTFYPTNSFSSFLPPEKSPANR